MANKRETIIWRVWPGREMNTAETNDLGSGTTSIQWYEVPDLTHVSEDELDEMLERLYPGHMSNPMSKGSLLAFRDKITIGDYVVMAMRRPTPPQFSIGVVTGPYHYKAGRTEGSHLRTVKWLYTGIPRSILDADLKTAIETPATVSPIYNEHAAERILAACNMYVERSDTR